MNDVASRFSLKKLLVLPVVFSVAFTLWRISPLHGMVGLLAATALSGAILLAQQRDYVSLSWKFVLAVLFAVSAGIASEATSWSHGPPTATSLLRGYGAIIVGGMLGWSISNLVFGRDNAAGFSKSRLVLGTLTAVLLTIICSVPLWFHLWLNEQEQNFVRAESFAPTMRYYLTQNSAFDDIDIGPSKEHGGCILMSGILKTDEQLSELKNFVADNNPPVPVVYDVSIGAEMADVYDASE